MKLARVRELQGRATHGPHRLQVPSSFLHGTLWERKTVTRIKIMDSDMDDEAPPLLAEVQTGDVKSLEHTLDGVRLIKVPITIVTGKFGRRL
jgi:hypothetical protein